MTNTSRGPSRRTLVKGAAWSVPVVAIAAPAQAVGCSVDPIPCLPQCLTFQAAGTNLRRPNRNMYKVAWIITNTCEPGTVPPGTTVTLTMINEAGAQLSDFCTHAPVALTVTIPGPGESLTIPETEYWASSMAQRVYFYANGTQIGFADTGSIDNNLPLPDCPDGTPGADSRVADESVKAEETAAENSTEPVAPATESAPAAPAEAPAAPAEAPAAPAEAPAAPAEAPAADVTTESENG